MEKEAKTNDYNFIDYCREKFSNVNINKEELIEKVKTEYEKYKQAQN